MALYANGRAPDDALVHYRGLKASPDMARRVAWVEREYMKRNPGGYIRPNEIYRDYEAQVYWKLQEALGNTPSAATPGYSNHGDWDIGAVDWNADNIALRDELAAEVGLIRTVPSESWHYAVRYPSRVPLPSLAGQNYIELEELTPEEIEWNDIMANGQDIVNAVNGLADVIKNADDATKDAFIMRNYSDENGDNGVVSALVYPDGTAVRLDNSMDVEAAEIAHIQAYGLKPTNEKMPTTATKYGAQVNRDQWQWFWFLYPGKMIGFKDSDFPQGRRPKNADGTPKGA